MRRKTKIWLITATALIVAGWIIFAVVMSVLDWDFAKLSTDKYETAIYEISEAFDGISVKTKTADLILAVSEDGKCKVECYEEEKLKHYATVEDGTLVIKTKDDRGFADRIGISFNSPKVTVYLPQKEYGALTVEAATGDVKIFEGITFETADLSLSTGDVLFNASVSGGVKIQTSTGDITAKGISVGTLELSVATGEVKLIDVNCESLTTEGSTGSVSFSNVIAEEKLSVSRGSGDVKLNSCDAAELYLKTGTGDVKGSLLSGKVFDARTSTGRVDVPKTSNGGICRIETGTGDIKITLE